MTQEPSSSATEGLQTNTHTENTPQPSHITSVVKASIAESLRRKEETKEREGDDKMPDVR